MLVFKVAEDWPKPEVPGDNAKGHGTFARNSALRKLEERSAEKLTAPSRRRIEVKKENAPGGPSLIGMGP